MTNNRAIYYNPETYRPTINKALARAKRILLNGRTELEEWPRISAEGLKDFEDLRQLVDVEIWKATKKYVDKMNEALAYTIARTQAARFLKLRLQEQTVLVVEDANGHAALLDEYKLPQGEPAGNPVLDEFGQPRRVSRFCSLDEDRSNSEGEAMRSRAEEEVNVQLVAQFLERSRLGMGELRVLVDGWYGTKRLVGEALLADPDVSVRDIPDVPKSTAARLKQVVLKEFREFLERVGQKPVSGDIYLRQGLLKDSSANWDKGQFLGHIDSVTGERAGKEVETEVETRGSSHQVFSATCGDNNRPSLTAR